MRWFISDTHFGHKNVIEYSGRPFGDVQSMDNVLIDKWNKRVEHGDDVFMLGDFGLTGIERLREVFLSLKGNIILIRGNHDGSVSKMKRIGFLTVLEEAVISVAGTRVLLTHCPYFGLSRFADEFNLHGHMHEKGTAEFNSFRQMCMSVELWNYMPVSEKVVEKEINKWRKHAATSDGGALTRSSGSDVGGDEA